MFGDLHLERGFAWAKPDAATRRRQAIRSTLTEVFRVADEVAADAVLCAGDLYENEFFTPDTQEFVASTFDCGRPVLVTPGNHDHWSSGSMYARANWSSNVHVYSASHFESFELAAGLRVWGAAHVAPTGTPGFFDAAPAWRVDSGPGDVDLALFHGSERAGFTHEGTDKVQHAPFDAAQVAHAGLTHAFVGHYHRASTGAHHTYPGNPDPLEFGETDGRGAVVVDISDGAAVSVRHVRVATTHCHQAEVDISECRSSTDVLDAVLSALQPLDGFVRIDLIGALGTEIDFDVRSLRQALPAAALEGLDDILIRNRARRRYDYESLRLETSVRGHFLDLVLDDPDLSDADRSLVAELGLRAFDNRTDLEVV